jgi:AraC-like DNA-binding protein
MVRATPADHYQLVVVFEGVLRFVRPDGDVLCEPGGACITDLTRPELMHATACHTAAVHVARWFLDEAVSPRDAHGPLPRTAAVKVLVDFVGALVRELPQMPATSALPMARVLRDLLATALAELPPRPAATEAHSPVRQRVRAYIEAEPMGELSLERMCQALGLTRSSINRAFKAEGGVMAYDRRRRLVALHGRLSDPTEGRSIAELGYDYGFPEKTHLSRVFREAFGYAPSELRRQAARMTPHVAEPGSLQETYKTALRRLS